MLFRSTLVLGLAGSLVGGLLGNLIAGEAFSIAAAGLMRYGFVDHAHRVILALLDAAGAFGGRLPELFAGFDRAEHEFPVSFPGSCSPQAWAAASPLLMVRSLLRFEPWIPSGKLWLAPALPDAIGWLRIDDVPLLGGRITIEVDGTEVKVEGLPDGIEVISEPSAVVP